MAVATAPTAQRSPRFLLICTSVIIVIRNSFQAGLLEEFAVGYPLAVVGPACKAKVASATSRRFNIHAVDPHGR